MIFSLIFSHWGCKPTQLRENKVLEQAPGLLETNRDRKQKGSYYLEFEALK